MNVIKQIRYADLDRFPAGSLRRLGNKGSSDKPAENKLLKANLALPTNTKSSERIPGSRS